MCESGRKASPLQTLCNVLDPITTLLLPPRSVTEMCLILQMGQKNPRCPSRNLSMILLVEIIIIDIILTALLVPGRYVRVSDAREHLIPADRAILIHGVCEHDSSIVTGGVTPANVLDRHCFLFVSVFNRHPMSLKV